KVGGRLDDRARHANQYVHLWSYPSLDERDRLRGELAKNDEWTKGYVPQIRPLLLAQENKILSAVTPFKPPTDSGNLYELRWYRAGRQARRVAESGQGRAAEPREIFAQRLLLADGGRPAQRGRASLGLQGPQRTGHRAGEGARRSRLAGLPRQGPAAADQHAVHGAHPDHRVTDEMSACFFRRPSGRRASRSRRRGESARGALRRRPDGK